MNLNTKRFKIPKATVTGAATATVATFPVPYGQSARIKTCLRGAAADKSFYGETLSVVRNGPGAVAFAAATAPDSGGTGYTTDTGVATTVVSQDGSASDGTGLTVDFTAVDGAITALTVNAAGDRYKPGDVITVTGGGANATYTLLPSDVVTIAIVGNTEDIKLDDVAAGTPAIVVAAPATTTDKSVRFRATAATADTVVEGYFDVDYFANTPV
jgi:hypothetical protein